MENTCNSCGKATALGKVTLTETISGNKVIFCDNACVEKWCKNRGYFSTNRGLNRTKKSKILLFDFAIILATFGAFLGYINYKGRLCFI